MIKKIQFIKISKVFLIVILAVLGVIVTFTIFLFTLFTSGMKLEIVHFDMDKSIVDIKYEGDCGATCDYGNINVYQRNKGLFSSKKNIFSIKETPPEEFDFKKISETQIQIHKKQPSGEFCIKNPFVDLCKEKNYLINIF